MEDVCNGLCDLDDEELYSRSGRKKDRYVEPYDEAWVMIDEVLDPFIYEMKKYQKLNMPILAKEYCIGIIKGIQNFGKASSDILEWAEDAPKEKIETVFDEWKEGHPSEEYIAEVSQIIEED